MEKELKIDVPAGYEIDREKSTLEHIVFKKKNEKLPTSLSELPKKKRWYINTNAEIHSVSSIYKPERHDKNLWPTYELAEAALALSELMNYRDVWNDGWEPDWTNGHECKYVIETTHNLLKKTEYYNANTPLSFKTEELRDKFFDTFKDLLEIAKPLLYHGKL